MNNQLPSQDEKRRLQALWQYEVLDTPPEDAFDELTAMAAQVCEAPIALISLIDENRQWFKSHVGLTATETKRNISFCAHAIHQTELFIVPDAVLDERFANNPLVTADPHIRFYAGAPLVTPEGQALGTLCVIDRVPRQLSERQQQALGVLSRNVIAQLELRRRAREMARAHAERDQVQQELRREHGDIKALWRTIEEQNQVTVAPDHKQIVERLGLANRQLRMLSQCNQVLIRASDEMELLTSICRIAVEMGGYRMAWVGSPQNDTGKTVKPVAQAGVDDGYLQNVTVSWADNEHGCGPTGKAIRLGLVFIARNLTNEPAYDAWRKEALKRNYASSISLPLLTGEKTLGSFTIYSERPDAFDIEEVSLLSELANDLAFGIAARRTQVAHKQSEEQVRGSESKLRALFENSRDAIGVSDAGLHVLVNPAYLAMFGYDRESELIGNPILNLIAPSQRLLVARNIDRRGKDDSAPTFYQTRGLRKDGIEFDMEVSVSPFELENKINVLVLLRDVTERKKNEAALREKDYLLFESQRIAKIGSWSLEPGTLRLLWSEETYLVFGVTPDSFVPSLETVQRLVHPEDWPEIQKWIQECLSGRKPRDLEFRAIRPDGSLRLLSCFGDLRSASDHSPSCMVGTLQDVTLRRQAEEALRESERKYHAIFNATTDAIFIQDAATGRLLGVNDSMLRIYGFDSEEEVLHCSIGDLSSNEPFFTAAEAAIHLKKTLVEGPQFFQWRAKRKSGELFWAEVSLRGYAAGDGQCILVVVRDITERKRVQDEHARLATAVEQAVEMVLITDNKGVILYVNPAFERITGYHREEAIGRNPRMIQSGKHGPEFYQKLWTTIARGQVWAGHLINRRKNGTLFEEETTISPVRDSAGKIVNYVAVKRDVTQEVALAAQLRQSQKMEAIGQLAGGVAHDFNNLLTIIQGNTTLLGNADLHLNEEEKRGCFDDILHAAERAAGLTRQLLVFSRKEAIQATHLNLNQVVSDLVKMLKRILGEDIELRSELAPGLPPVFADAGMMEQVLLNLGVNARDAMPAGGKLTILTGLQRFSEKQAQENPPAMPGAYVWFSVSDTGCGIPPEILPQIFEPFFTTKEAGKGTGLGLATVYSIVRQHHGWIQVVSEAGQGSTFQVYLPAVKKPCPEQDSAAAAELPRGTETILVVEDESALLMVVGRVLERCGYTVLRADCGPAAIKVWGENKERIALVLTDLVMPLGISGIDLATIFQGENPKLKVIYASGYTKKPGKGLPLVEGLNFLQKPYSFQKLAQTVRSALDRGQAS